MGTKKNWAIASTAAVLIAGLTPVAATAAPLTVNCTPDSGYTHCFSFLHSASVNTFPLPASLVGTNIKIQLWGAGGGGVNNYWNGQPGGGGGAYVAANYYVASASNIYFQAGEGGRTNDTTGQIGGGGAGGSATYAGSSGGGFTAVWSSYTGDYSTSTLLALAGGGGGASPGSLETGAAGGGGALSGSGLNGGPTDENGQGGSQIAGGAAATVLGSCASAATAGSAFQGGSGAVSTAGSSEGGGGGGGGYYGGGGGRCQSSIDTVQNGAGGGGSSWADTGALTNLTSTAGASGSMYGGAGIGGNSGGNIVTQYEPGVGKGGNAYGTNLSVPSQGGDGQVVIQWTMNIADDISSQGELNEQQSATISATVGSSYELATPDSPGGLVHTTPEGVYVLDPATGIMTFTPTSGFVGLASPIGIVVTDSYGAEEEVIYFAEVLAGEATPISGPTVTKALPATANSGDSVEILGQKLANASAVTVGGISVPFSYVNGVLTIDTADLPQGRHDVTVTSPLGRATLNYGLTILHPDSFWTKRVSETEVKIYAKHVVGIGKVTFHVDGREIAWVNAVDATDPKLRAALGAYYLVRTVELHQGKNRFEIKLDGVRHRRATYVG